MFNFARLSLGLVARCFRSRRRLLLENLALRQQLAVLKRRQARPKLGRFDKLFWILACRFWTELRRRTSSACPRSLSVSSTNAWILQQLREAFPFGTAPRFLIHDRDAKYGTEVPAPFDP
jgi:hypothetical protein